MASRQSTLPPLPEDDAEPMETSGEASKTSHPLDEDGTASATSEQEAQGARAEDVLHAALDGAEFGYVMESPLEYKMKRKFFHTPAAYAVSNLRDCEV